MVTPRGDASHAGSVNAGLLLALLMCAAVGADAGSDLVFSPPVKVNAEWYGFEPGIKAGPDGALHITAHKSTRTNEGPRLSSWLWRSADQGQTWSEMPSPAQVHTLFSAQENDVAIDGVGRVYMVDTYLADNTVTRWSPGPVGPSWDFTLPIQGTIDQDDRPWLEADGDGIVYYLGNGAAVSGALAGHLTPAGGTQFYVSEDGALSWERRRLFIDEGWCEMAPSNLDDAKIVVGCLAGDAVAIHTSPDRGRTWSDRSFTMETGAGLGEFVSLALDAADNAFFAWVVTPSPPAEPDRVYLARSINDGLWTVSDVTPFPGSFSHVWVAAGQTGTVALVYYGSTERTPSSLQKWNVYAAVAANAQDPTPAWHVSVADPVAVDGDGPLDDGQPPADFFQVAIGPDNIVNIAYARELHGFPFAKLYYPNDTLFVRQVAGPNLVPAG